MVWDQYLFGLRGQTVAHRLEPVDDSSYLLPDEIVRRLEAEFVLVDVDAAAGVEHVAAMIRQFERTQAPVSLIEEHRRMQRAAVHLVVADDPNPGKAYLSFVALPGESLLVGYSSGQHEEAASPLLARCCKALNYEPHLV